MSQQPKLHNPEGNVHPDREIKNYCHSYLMWKKSHKFHGPQSFTTEEERLQGNAAIGKWKGKARPNRSCWRIFFRSQPGIRLSVNILQVLRSELTILLSSDQKNFLGKRKLVLNAVKFLQLQKLYCKSCFLL